jgi:sporulation protein YlmC with PRC-barrel domain
VELSRSLNCGEIKKCDVVDSDGDAIGHIGDMTFLFEDGLHLKHFILSGSRWEEFLETIKVKPDKDPVFDASLIEAMGDNIKLNTSANSLKTTLDKGAIPEGEIRLSTLEDMDIFDIDSVKVGRAIDVDFDDDGTAMLTVGGGMIEETLESIGLKADVDIIVPAETIESIADKIMLNVSKADLKLTMDDALEKEMAQKTRDDYATERVKVRLYTQRFR